MDAVRTQNLILVDDELCHLTEDDLPSEDGMPMETARHRLQMNLLIEPLELAWKERQDFYVGGNMFVYFSPKQEFTYDFRGPDVFVVLDVPKRDRKSWVVWQEGKAPDVVIELLSDATLKADKGTKKLVYQNRLRVPEYFWYDPFSNNFAGFELYRGRYRRMRPDKHGRLISQQLNLALVRWQGTYLNVEATWLRWATLAGVVLPTAEEQAETANRRVVELEAEIRRYQQQFGTLIADPA